MIQSAFAQDDFIQKPGSVIVSITRQNASPCDHYVTIIDEDGTGTITLTFASVELDEPITDEERKTVARLWGKFQRKRGRTLTEMVGRQIFAEIP